MNENVELAARIKEIEALQAQILRFTLLNEDSRSEDWLIDVALKGMLARLKADFRESTDSRTPRG